MSANNEKSVHNQSAECPLPSLCVIPNVAVRVFCTTCFGAVVGAIIHVVAIVGGCIVRNVSRSLSHSFLALRFQLINLRRLEHHSGGRTPDHGCPGKRCNKRGFVARNRKSQNDASVDAKNNITLGIHADIGWSDKGSRTVI